MRGCGSSTARRHRKRSTCSDAAIDLKVLSVIWNDGGVAVIPRAAKQFLTTWRMGLREHLQHAEGLQRENERNGSSNPATKMHEVVTHLMRLKE
jgi:hypothetical protein